ncbi:class I SAM-dependent methyltransferase [Isachenkonia alkalipeptolytica]|uniref:Class I SAM-dependent methyltransferase n=1 Tax=Isachenkonia alkalipeptolytica TaxID=2565777 RepID=A0AA44BE53_9CLOT|nr:class I SAM-dependent methyltransferase [Isachenkonia alkalipeptolytica]NBG88662.1 class I SAM-dependent methyltransferase [Isachenkonia alkalipeptolytica]
MTSTDEKLAKSLTAESVELIPYLPYLLQDLWELGSSPRDIMELITTHVPNPGKKRVLDLACGKGAVAVHLAKAFGCPVKGIDMMAAFIAEAKKKAAEHQTEALCEFVTGDVHEAVSRERNYDMVIFGAAGDVLGTPKETLAALKKTLTEKGYLILDDAYGKEGSHGEYYTKAQWLEFFRHAGVELLGEKTMDPGELKALNRQQQACIVKRAEELKVKYPEKSRMFQDYVKSQQAECDELENDITGVTMLLR